MSGQLLPFSLTSMPFWRTAVRIAWRDLCFSRKRAAAAVMTIAAGVAAVTAVRLLASEMHAKVSGNAREWIAADVYVNLKDAPSQEENTALAPLLNSGVEQTTVTELYGMVSSDHVPDPALVFVKVVDPRRYPFYGTVELRPPMALPQALRADSIVVSRNLMEEMRLTAGDNVRVGKAQFRIAAEIAAEPDWSAGLSTVLPRILLTAEGFSRSALTLHGDVVHKLLFRLGRTDLMEVRHRLEQIFPDTEVVDYRDPDPSAAAAFDQAAGFLVVAAWMALAVGSLAVAMITHLHMQQRMQAVAVMKALGARSSQILTVYATQALGLALAGGVLGTVAAQPVELLLAALAQRLFPVHLEARWNWIYAVEAIAAALLAAVPSVAVPIRRARRISPLAVLRQGQTALPQVFGSSPRGRLSGGWSPPAGGSRLPLALRLALRNISRRGNHSAAMALALSGGVAMLCATYLCQRQISEKVAQTVPARGSNLYLISTGRSQLDQAADWLAGQPGVEGRPQAFPLISLRLDRINGASVSPHSTAMPRMWLATCSDEKARGEVVASRAASLLHLKTGDLLEFSARGHSIRRRVAGRAASYMDEIISLLTFPCSDFENLPVYYHAAVRIDPSQEATVRRALSARYPGLPTLSRTEFTRLLQKISGETGSMVRLVSWAVLAIGIVLEFLLIAASKRLRLEEIAVAKTLGARPRLLQSIFLVEFGIVGLFAGVIGGLLGTGLASLLLTALLRRTTIAFDLEILLWVVGLTVMFAGAAGGLSGAAMLRHKPLDILREQG